jgi:FtsH-binding integral membrane protein
MKSVVQTLFIFIVLGIIISSGIIDFFAQKSVLIFAIASVFVMLIIAFVTLNLYKAKEGEKNDKK